MTVVSLKKKEDPKAVNSNRNQELRSVLEQWIRLRAQLSGRIEILWHDCRVAMLVPPSEQRKYVGCGAGRLVARIMPDGSVTPCVFLPTTIGNIARTPFRELWTSSDLLCSFRSRQGAITGNCGRCAHLSTCGGCRAVAFAYSKGDPLAGDPHCWVETASMDQLRRVLEVA